MAKKTSVTDISKLPVKSVDPDKNEITVDADQLHWISKVRTFDADIRSFKSRIDTIKEQLQEIKENTTEYDYVLECTRNLAEARENLKRVLDGKSEYVNLCEELADEKLSLKDAEANMSDFLLGYFAETKERQIELGGKDARDVILKGKLGKPRDYQTNLFRQDLAKDNNNAG